MILSFGAAKEITEVRFMRLKVFLPASAALLLSLACINDATPRAAVAQAFTAGRTEDVNLTEGRSWSYLLRRL